MSGPVGVVVKGGKQLISSPPLMLGIVVGAVNTAEDQSWKGYATAVATALLWFVVKPVFDKR